MKKLLLFLLLSLGLSTISYAGPYDNWPDDAVCMWLDIKPTHAGYLGEAKKRGLGCGAGIATKASSTMSDELLPNTLKQIKVVKYWEPVSDFKALKEYAKLVP